MSFHKWWNICTTILYILKDGVIWFLYTYLLYSPYTPKQYVHLIEKHGPVFIKVFQLISQREDLPNDIRKEVERLQDGVTPHSWNYTKEYMEKELTGQWRQLLECTDKKALASGSISQVHKATISNGKRVVVKVIHPNAKEQIEASLFVVELFFSMLSFFGFHRLVDSTSFQNDIRMQVELDYEFRNLEMFREHFKRFPMVHVPEPLFVSDHLLVESFEEGMNIRKFCESHPLYTCEAIHLLLCVYHYMHAESHFIHGDPHFGNFLFYLKNGKVHITILDAGMILKMTDHDAKFFVDTLIIPYIFSYDRISEFIRLVNMNPYANLNQFQQVFDKRMDWVIKLTGRLKKEKRRRDMLYTILDNNNYESAASSMIVETTKFKVQAPSHRIFCVMFITMMLASCYTIYPQKSRMMYNLVEYGVQNQFFKRSKILDEMLEEKREMDKEMVERILV